MSNPDGAETGAVPSWRLPDAEWGNAVRRVRAGRSLSPRSWPNGARAAVALSFDADHETIALRDSNFEIGALASGEYGARVGSRRICALLEKYGIPATFFVPGVTALLHPEEVRAYAERGHEVALHGWIHERSVLLAPDEQRELTRRSIDALCELCGKPPVGTRAPSCDFSAVTIPIMREFGIVYDSSLMADDEPYELLEDGRSTGLVEIPMDWIRDDAAYFVTERYGPYRPYLSPRAWLSILMDEFVSAYEAGGLFELVCHPDIIGHRSRIMVLDELLGRIGDLPGVWYATHEAIARYVVAGGREDVGAGDGK